MANPPSLVFVHGSWHKPTCYDKVVTILRDEHKLKCTAITLPSTDYNPSATLKDDIDTVRKAITSETTQGHDVVVIAHSYGGMPSSSAIKGLTLPKPPITTTNTTTNTDTTTDLKADGHVLALVLLASGFTITGLAFMDPFFGIPPPLWHADWDTGYAILNGNPRNIFYHDLPDTEAEYWVSQLTSQNLKAVYEGGEHAYAGWRDVPTWYVGTLEDKSLPLVAQRVQVGAARAMGGDVRHVELVSGHSPFLSVPREVAEVVLVVIGEVGRGGEIQVEGRSEMERGKKRDLYDATAVRFRAPGTWFRFGVPLLFGRVLGWGIVGFLGLRNFWRRR